MFRLEGDHRAEENRTRKERRAGEHHAGGDVRAVGEAHRDELRGIQLVLRHRAVDEANELLRAQREILEIEHALGEPLEESWCAALANGTARTEDRRAREEGLAERDEIVLVAAGAVQEEERR